MKLSSNLQTVISSRKSLLIPIVPLDLPDRETFWSHKVGDLGKTQPYLISRKHMILMNSDTDCYCRLLRMQQQIRKSGTTS